MISTFLYPMLSPAGCKKSDHRSTQRLKNNIFFNLNPRVKEKGIAELTSCPLSEFIIKPA